MAKEPKLLAEIRASHARALKEFKHAPPVPVGPIMSASVVTPDVKAPPNNYIATTLDECTTLAQLRELLEHAKQHGYSDDGQTVQLIRKRIAELGHEELIGAQKATPRKRGGRR